MAKFSLGPLPDIDFAGTSFLHLESNVATYELAADLNALYHLRLHRIPTDINLSDAEWPIYHFADESHYLNYILIETPHTSTPLPFLRPQNKVLVVQGRDAEEVVDTIEGELLTPTLRTDLLDAQERLRIVQYQHEHLFSSGIIHFSDDDTAAASSRRRKSLRGTAALAALMADMLDLLCLQGITRDWD